MTEVSKTEVSKTEVSVNGASLAEVDAALNDAAAVLARAESIVVIGHVGPDGDALGSALGLALAARNAGKSAYATFGEPFVVPDQLRFLPTDALVSPGELAARAFDVAVAVDVAAPDRLGSAAAIVAAAGEFVVIDHHITNDGFGDVSVVDPNAAATAEVIHRLLVRLDWEIDEPIAEALYVGLVTDTGRFQYSATSPAVHQIAADLLQRGVSPARVGRHLYEESPFGFLHVAGAVLSRAELRPEVSLVWSRLTMEDLAAAGISYEQADGLIDLIRVAEEADVSCLLRDLGDGRTKGSLRSRGGTDVGAVAAALGGGGHRNAAGFTFDGTPADAIARVAALLA
jgi:phosphoesterase RecJ-like protein